MYRRIPLSSIAPIGYAYASPFIIFFADYGVLLHVSVR